MTTAHRPTFDPARGKEALRGPAYHQRLLTAYTKLKFRQPGQGGDGDSAPRDLRAELLAAEAAHAKTTKGGPLAQIDDGQQAAAASRVPAKRALEDGPKEGGGTEEETLEAKRRRVLEASRAIDADSDSDGSQDEDGENGSDKAEDEDDDDDEEEDDDSDEDSEDEIAELQRELAKVRQEKAEKAAKKQQEEAAAAERDRQREVAMGNPLLNQSHDFNIKRRWDDDVVFKNQARGTDDRNKKKEFINDSLRSDFHKRFMSRYVR